VSDPPLTTAVVTILRLAKRSSQTRAQPDEEGTRVVHQQQQQHVASNEWGTIAYWPEWKTLELKWEPATRSMGDDGFRQTLQLFADEGVRLRPVSMIVDSTEFFHQVADSTFAWRNEQIIPLYNQAGVRKFAFLATSGAPNTVEKGVEPAPDGPANFPTAWFESRDRMYAWLSA
jgi:hypothetical protein